MKKLLLHCFVLLVVSGMAQNLVVNPGFENGLNSWYVNTNAPGFTTILPDNTVAHSGGNSLRININHDTVGGIGLVSQVFVLRAGGHYLLDCFIKTDSVVNGGAFPYPILYLGGVRLYGDGGYTVGGSSNGWQEVYFRFYMPQGSDTLQLLVGLGAKSGTAWFDDISISALTDTSYTQFSVNLDSASGTLVRPFTSTNVGPIDPVVSSIDLTSRFQELGVEYVRTHDFEGPCDMHIIFPDTTRSAFDSTAYDFFWTDSVIKACVHAGSKIYFRVGESGNPNTSLYDPPHDFNKWAQVAVHIMEHYNHGWDHGYNFDIKYWEIYNEPDLGWNGTINQYIELYRLASIGLKTADSTLLIGGPAISSLSNSDFLNAFLDSVHTENLPFDFFSYHYYHTFNPYDFARYDNDAKQLLARFGLANVERIVSEWSNYNYNPGNNYYVWRNDPLIAASTVAALTYYQNTDVSKLLRYRTDGTDLGMIDAAGNYNYTGLAYYYMSLFRNVPDRILATGGDTLGTSILAGSAANGSLTGILIGNNSSAANGYDLSINGISSTEQYSYSIFRIDSNIASTAIDSGFLTAGNNKLILPVKAPFADLIVLTKMALNGIANATLSGGMNVFPNPFSNQITIRYSSIKEIVQGIYITDVLGRVVKTFSEAECRESSQVQWNCNNQSVRGGMYIVRLQTDKAVYESTVVRME